ncbi:MAG: hypothetical protein MZV70_41545 [Desulfobacterales bacterium]|nr:hypothetical protein [Desulfobacterales bacterium]
MAKLSLVRPRRRRHGAATSSTPAASPRTSSTRGPLSLLGALCIAAAPEWEEPATSCSASS